MEHKWHSQALEGLNISGRIVIDTPLGEIQESSIRSWAMEFKCSTSILEIQFRVEEPYQKRYSEWINAVSKGETISFKEFSSFYAITRSKESMAFHYDCATFISDNDDYKIVASTNVYCPVDCLMSLRIPKLAICPLLTTLLNEAKKDNHLYFYSEKPSKLCVVS